MFSLAKILARPNSDTKSRNRRFHCAVEQLEDRTAPAVFAVNSTVDAVDANLGDGVAADAFGRTTLRAAIQEANYHYGQDTILLGVGRFRFGIGGTGEGGAARGDLDILSSIKIEGAGAGQTIIDAAGLDRVFQIHSSGSLNISGVTVTGGMAKDDPFDSRLPDPRYPQGGGFYNLGTLSISDSEITANAAATHLGQGSNVAWGGGVFNTGTGSTVIVRSTFSANTGRAGTAVAMLGGTVIINDTVIAQNHSDTGAGAAVYNGQSHSSSLTVSRSTISNNSGGGIENRGDGLFTDCVISGNTTSAWNGGGIHNTGPMTVLRCTISDNHAPITNDIGKNVGGGIYTGSSSPVTISDSTISGNTAEAYGGGIWASGPVTITNSTISGNATIRSDGWGGGIRGEVTLINSTVAGNTAATGGGLSGNGTVKNSIIAGNTATVSDPDVNGRITSQGHNLIGDVGSAHTSSNTNSLNLVQTILDRYGYVDYGDQPVTGFEHGKNGDQVGGHGNPVIDPLLGPLQDNGGATWTHALLPGSPALDAGDNSGAPAADQRGIRRPQDGNIDGVAVTDIGAFEVEFEIEAPTITGPAGSIGAVRPAITWTAVEGAARFEVWINDETDGTVKAAYTTEATGNSWTASPALAPGHSYKVWVRGLAADGKEGAWSKGDVFAISSLQTPQITSAASDDGSRPVITWTEIDHAERFEVWINDVTSGEAKILHVANVTETSWTVPFDPVPEHLYRVWVRAHAGQGSSNWSAPADFPTNELESPVITEPSASTYLTTPQIGWTEVNRAERYEVWINNLTTGESKVAYTDQVTDDVWTVPARLTLQHTYRVWVRAHTADAASDWSDYADFEVKPIGKAIITGPVGVIANRIPEITWDSVDGATSYTLWVNDETTGEARVRYDDSVTGTSWSPSQPLSPGHAYRVWVKADIDGQPGTWSLPATFSIKSLNRPVVIGPIGATPYLAPEAVWTEDPVAGHYEVWINDLTAKETKVVYNANVVTNRLTLPQLNPDHTYRMWVRAHAGGQGGAWSEFQDFEITDTLFVRPVGTRRMAHTDTSLTIDLPQEDADGNSLTYSVAVISNVELAYQLDQEHEFESEAMTLQGWGGAGEKWIKASGNTWFFILPSGRLYKWSKGNAGSEMLTQNTLIATLDGSFFDDAQKLINAQPPANDSGGGTNDGTLDDLLNRRRYNTALTLDSSSLGGGLIHRSAPVTATASESQGRSAEIVNGNQIRLQSENDAPGEVSLRLTANNGTKTQEEIVKVIVSDMDALAAMPGRLLVIRNPGMFDADAEHFVRFSNDKGFSLNVPVIDADEDSITVSVPPVFDTATGQLASGNVNIEVYQDTERVNLLDTGRFELKELPTPAVGVGETTLGFLRASLDMTNSLQKRIMATELETAEMSQALTDQVSELTSLIAEVQSIVDDTLSLVTIESINDRAIAFGKTELAIADSLIAGMLIEQSRLDPSGTAAHYVNAILSSPGQIDAARKDYASAMIDAPSFSAIKVAGGLGIISGNLLLDSFLNLRRSQENSLPAAAASPLSSIQGAGFLARGAALPITGTATTAALQRALPIPKPIDVLIDKLNENGNDIRQKAENEFLRRITNIEETTGVHSGLCKIHVLSSHAIWGQQADMVFRVVTYGKKNEEVKYRYQVLPGSAINGEHFKSKPISGAQSMICNQFGEIRVSLGETKPDRPVTFAVQIAPLSNLSSMPAYAVGTIYPPAYQLPSLSIHSTGLSSVNEGNDASTRFVEFEVKLSEKLTEDVYFSYATAPHIGASHPASPAGDYDFKSAERGVITKGTQSTTIQIPVKHDTIDEYDETFVVSLVQVHTNNAVISKQKSEATATILDDDAAPTLTIKPAHQEVSEEKDRMAKIEVELSEVSERDVTFYYKTGEGNATPGKDYVSVDVYTAATIRAGEKSASFEIGILNDIVNEWNEQFNFIINNTDKKPQGAAITANKATVRIVETDIEVYAPSGTVRELSPLFSWSSVSGVNNYDVFVSDVNNPKIPVLWPGSVPDNRWRPSTPLQNGHRYHVWVRAILPDGTYGDWSPPKTFLIESADIVVETPLHHLGDGGFSTYLNSALETQKAEGASFSKSFLVRETQLAPYFSRATLEITVNGAEVGNPVVLNGATIARLNNSIPGQQTFYFAFDISILKPGTNTLTILAAGDATGGLDDFEFKNVKIRLGG